MEIVTIVLYILLGILVVIGLLAFLAFLFVSSPEAYKEIRICQKCRHCKLTVNKNNNPVLGCFHPSLANYGLLNIITGELRGIPCKDARRDFRDWDSFCGAIGYHYEAIEDVSKEDNNEKES